MKARICRGWNVANDLLAKLDSFSALLHSTAQGETDYESVSGIFEPTLRSICELVETGATTKFKLNDGWNQASDRIVKDALKAIEKRAASWTAENTDEVAGPEFVKTLKGIVLNVYREAGAATWTTGGV